MTEHIPGMLYAACCAVGVWCVMMVIYDLWAIVAHAVRRGKDNEQ